MTNNNMTWILVTDGGHARVFVQDNKSEPIRLLHELTHTHEPTRDGAVHSKPGSVFESAAPAHHAYSPKTDWHEHQKEVFATELSQLLIKEHQKNKFRDVYFICPPRFMGYLRSHIEHYAHNLPPAEKLRIKEVPKDLGYFTDWAVEQYLKELD